MNLYWGKPKVPASVSSVVVSLHLQVPASVATPTS